MQNIKAQGSQPRVTTRGTTRGAYIHTYTLFTVTHSLYCAATTLTSDSCYSLSSISLSLTLQAFCCAFYPRATLQARTNEALADRSASWCEAVRVRRCVANVLGTALCARRHVCPVPTEEEVVWRRRRGRNRECAPRCSAAASRQATRTQSVVPTAATRCAPSRTVSFAHLP